jgi:cytochrome P450
MCFVASILELESASAHRPIRAIHMNDKRWSGPGRFDPTRYLDDSLTEAESMAQVNLELRDRFTFGAGRRNCPGLHIAHNSLFINIARIM